MNCFKSNKGENINLLGASVACSHILLYIMTLLINNIESLAPFRLLKETLFFYVSGPGRVACFISNWLLFILTLSAKLADHHTSLHFSMCSASGFWFFYFPPFPHLFYILAFISVRILKFFHATWKGSNFKN